MARETVGKVATDLLKKKHDPVSVIEQSAAQHKDYVTTIKECIQNGKQATVGDFFVVVDTKKEPILENVIKNTIFWRHSCPTPNYDQTVYMYIRKDDDLKFLWTVPCRDACFLLRENRTRVVKEEYGLLDFVLKFDNGTLYALAKKLNNEKDDSTEVLK